MLSFVFCDKWSFWKLGAGWLQEYKVGLLEAFLCVLQVFWVVHFRGDSAEFLVELSLRWAPQGHLGFQGEIRGGSCQFGIRALGC